MSIRIAVIGTGIMGWAHARIVAEDMPGAELKVVCDADFSKARRVADELGASDVSTDASTIAAREDVDAVIIASPDATHPTLCLETIRHRKFILCEKPLAPDVKGCLEVIEAETAAGRRLVQVGFMRRFDPSYVEMKSELREGVVGSALMLHCVHRNVSAPPDFKGFMAVSNSAPHEFDIARYVLDTDIAAISVFQPKGFDAKTVAPIFMVVETTGGQLVNIEVNNNAGYGYDVRGELVGAAGSITLAAPIHTRVNADLASFERYPVDWIPRFADAYRLQNKAWLRAVQTGSWHPDAASCWDGYWASLVAEAGVKALETKSRVQLNAVERPPIYA
jgi:myo-inositol 2-dehydrogenase/D-chiro-inositol 1-dehydrogenase